MPFLHSWPTRAIKTLSLPHHGACMAAAARTSAWGHPPGHPVLNTSPSPPVSVAIDVRVPAPAARVQGHADARTPCVGLDPLACRG